jgi:hypothetical protein
MMLRSKEEVRAAAEAFAWYVASGRIGRQTAETQHNIIGVIACLEWVQGEGAGNPVADSLRDIGKMRAGEEADAHLRHLR